MVTINGFNAKSPTIKRILQESKEMSRNPDPSLSAAPLEENLFEWHFTITGPPSSPYEAGTYHGRIVLPPSYPLRPPMFRFLTPTGRFETNREICLSISGHHEETWQPAWGIRTALCAIRAFMESEAKGQVGGLDASDVARRRIARESRAWRCATCGNRTMDEVMRDCATRYEEARAKGQAGGDDEAKRNEIPEELRLAYKDELKGNKEKREEETSSGEEVTKNSSSSSTPHQTTTSTGQGETAAAAFAPTTAPTVSARQTSTGISSSTTAPSQESRLYPQTVQQHRSLPADGVPAWIDKAIFGVSLGLIFMILKQFYV